jgi:hypothetical protein
MKVKIKLLSNETRMYFIQFQFNGFGFNQAFIVIQNFNLGGELIITFNLQRICKNQTMHAFALDEWLANSNIYIVHPPMCQ